MAWKHQLNVLALLGFFTATSDAQPDVCGSPPLNTKLVGGGDAQEGSWPWQASLQNFGSHVCGGSLIHKEWVLSAAHCFYGTSTGGWSVSLGRQNLQGNNSNEVTKTVATIILHPGFNIFTLDNDIALLRLSSPVTFSDYVRPVCLAANGSVFNNGTRSWVTGWGTVQGGAPIPFPGALREAEFPVLGNRQCSCLIGVDLVTDKIICVGFPEGGKDACQGDAGGPMVSEQDGIWIQSGIVRFGFGCARPNNPGVHTRVSRYQSWINSRMGSDKPGFVQFNSSGLDADSNYTCPGPPPPAPEETSEAEDLVPSLSSAELCGIPSQRNKIVGGDVVAAGSWPWQASLQTFGSHVCGGTLINSEWVLSAAHCFGSISTTGWSVSLGRRNLEGIEPNEVALPVAEIILHPLFDNQIFDNDIALLRLSSAVEFNAFVRPVCLAANTSVFNNGTESWVTGWGSVQQGVPLPSPKTLREVQVPVLGNRQCNCLNGEGVVTDNMICAGFLEGGKDTCQGDSGGPMVSEQDGIWIQSGIVSFGFGCAQQNNPGIYTRVSRYQPWIASRIGSDKPGFVHFDSRGPDADSSYSCPRPPLEDLPSAELCGSPSLSTKIVGGEDAQEGSWPWQASVQIFATHVCGGSLINRDWVMSAAHCFSSTSTFGWEVSLGRRNLLASNPNEVTQTVATIVLHPGFNIFTLDNDIALLRLSSPVTFSDYIRPVCLAASGSVIDTGTHSWVTGWGTIQSGVLLPFPATLQEVNIPVVGNRECNCLNGVGLITDNMICAGFPEGGKDACQGDSGGPMVSERDDVWIQSGIVSFGFGCARPNNPGVYVRVSRYQSWINAHLGSDKPGFVRIDSSGTNADSDYTCPGLPPPVTEGPATTTDAVPSISSVGCGIPLPKTKIARGGEAQEGSWPWQASLQNFGTHVCGGSLINREWVLSAAQCFSSTSVLGWSASLGLQNLKGNNSNKVSRNVQTIILHPGFDIFSLDNDIALLRLSSPVTFSEYIRPVCLAANSSVFNNGTRSWVTGWGTVQRRASLSFAGKLQEVLVPVLGNRQCNCLNGVGLVTDNMICAGFLEGGKDTCLGDSGGPMVSKQDGIWIQSGIISFGFGCARPRNPGVHARVSRYQSWINSHMGSDKPGFVQFNFSGMDADGNYTCPGLTRPVTEGPYSTLTTAAAVTKETVSVISSSEGPYSTFTTASAVTKETVSVISSSEGPYSTFTTASAVTEDTVSVVSSAEGPYSTFTTAAAVTEETVSVISSSEGPYSTFTTAVTEDMVSVVSSAEGPYSTFTTAVTEDTVSVISSSEGPYSTLTTAAAVTEDTVSVISSGEGPYSTLTTAVTEDTVSIMSSAEMCGNQMVNSKIVGGLNASEGIWPWQASVQIFAAHVCGGSLINREWVMSAAHCFSSTSTFGWSVSLGRQNLQGDDPNEVTKPVATIILHPGFNIFTLDNDIALLRLSSPVTFSDYVRPVCLAANGSVFNNGTRSWVTGWGTVQGGVPIPFPGALREVEVPVLGNRQCSCLIGVDLVTDNIICAGFLDGKKDTCLGDSGGPMVSKQDGIWIQSGIIRVGSGCAGPNDPGLFARVSRYQSWISSHTGSDEPGFVHFDSSGLDADSNYSCPRPTPVVVPSAELCGSPSLSTKIASGEDAQEGSWPWQVSLQTFGHHVCGGSLINRDWVMSAAHCFSGTNTFGWEVFLGRQNLLASNPNEVTKTVATIVLHPNYNRSSYDNDIALLRLSSAVTFTDYIRPVCLAANGSVFNSGTDSWATGWGRVQEGEYFPFPKRLHEVQVPVLGNRRCNCLTAGSSVTDNMICVGVPKRGRYFCRGNSGGPMVSEQDGVWIQSGIGSFGFGCARPNLPAVYSRVSRYQSWISSHIGSDEPGFAQFNSGGRDVDSNSSCPPPPPEVAPSQEPDPISKTPSPTLPSPTGHVCGTAPLNNRVKSDRGLVAGGTWPWLVSLHKNGAYACAGTLITSSFVLTSAECFSNPAPNASDWTAYLGQKLVNGVEEFQVFSAIVSIAVSKLQGSNVAVLQLREDVSFSDYLQPVCLDISGARFFPFGTRCWTAGWGQANQDPSVEKSAGLRELETVVVSCGSAASDQENICTSSLDLQQGDVGGPLICKADSSWFLAAVVATGGRPPFADIQVFSKMARFGCFLKETVGALPSPAAPPSAGAPSSYGCSFLSFSVAWTSVYLVSRVCHGAA